MENIHVVKHEEKYLILDINTSRCLELDIDSYKSLIEENNANSFSNVYKEYNVLEKLGYFTPRQLTPIEEEDYTIHEVHLGAFTKCNLSCKYCFRHDNISEENSISVEQAIKLVDCIVEKLVFNKKVSWFFFNVGLTGETLVDFNFNNKLRNHILKIAQNNEMSLNCVFSNTNAVLLNEKNAKEMWNAADMTSISVSIDGPKYIHDATRCFYNGEGSYDIIEPNIIECNKKYRTVAEATLTGKMPYVTEIFTHLLSLGFGSICIKPVRINKDSEYAINHENIENVKKEYSKFIKFLISLDDNKLLDYLSRINERDFFGRFFYRLFTGQVVNGRCNATIGLISIDFKGDIYPCASLMGVEYFKIGNIFEDEDNWEKKRIELLRKIHIENKNECSECWAKNLCGGVCASSSFLNGGNITSPDLIECELIKHIIEQGMILMSEISNRSEVLMALDSRYRYRASGAVKPLAFCSYTVNSPLSDLTAWESAFRIELSKKEQLRGFKVWKDSRGLKANVMTLWDEKNFYLRVDIKSDELENRNGTGTLSNNSIVRFSVTSKGSVMPEEYSIGMRGNKPLILRHRLQDVPKNLLGEIDDAEIAVINDNDVTSYIVLIPWYHLKLFPQENTACMFNVAIYITENPYVPKAWLEWSPGIVVENDPELFGILKFIRTVQ